MKFNVRRGRSAAQGRHGQWCAIRRVHWGEFNDTMLIWLCFCQIGMDENTGAVAHPIAFSFSLGHCSFALRAGHLIGWDLVATAGYINFCLRISRDLSTIL